MTRGGGRGQEPSRVTKNESENETCNNETVVSIFSSILCAVPEEYDGNALDAFSTTTTTTTTRRAESKENNEIRTTATTKRKMAIRKVWEGRAFVIKNIKELKDQILYFIHHHHDNDDNEDKEEFVVWIQKLEMTCASLRRSIASFQQSIPYGRKSLLIWSTDLQTIASHDKRKTNSHLSHAAVLGHRLSRIIQRQWQCDETLFRFHVQSILRDSYHEINRILMSHSSLSPSLLIEISKRIQTLLELLHSKPLIENTIWILSKKLLNDWIHSHDDQTDFKTIVPSISKELTTTTTTITTKQQQQQQRHFEIANGKSLTISSSQEIALPKKTSEQQKSPSFHTSFSLPRGINTICSVDEITKIVHDILFLPMDQVKQFNSETFLQQQQQHKENHHHHHGYTRIETIFGLIVGSQGTGKTHLCQILESRYSSMDLVTVIRPDLPLDLLCPTVGASEDVLFSLFAYAVHHSSSSSSSSSSSPCLILLDGMDHILGTSAYGHANTDGGDERSNGSSVLLRRKSAFLSLVDTLRRRNYVGGGSGSVHDNKPHQTCVKNERDRDKDDDDNNNGHNLPTNNHHYCGGKILVLCTASHMPLDGSGTSDRFDWIVSLGPPNEMDRRNIIYHALYPAIKISHHQQQDNDDDDDDDDEVKNSRNNPVVVVGKKEQEKQMDGEKFNETTTTTTTTTIHIPRRSRPSSSSSMNDKLQINDPNMMLLLDDVVGCMAGQSVADISRYCRDVLIMEEMSTKSNFFLDKRDDSNFVELKKSYYYHHFQRRLRRLKDLLQRIMPESIKSGSLDGVVDLSVSTARQLQSMLKYNNNDISMKKKKKKKHHHPILPLYGSGAESAYRQLQALIVTPLCHSRELDKLLLYGGESKSTSPISSGSKSKLVCAGVLLTGPPGTGKTAMAYHCAAVASSIMPSIKLLNISCTSLIHKEVGGSERAIHSLFEAAKLSAPCILLLDGIEILAPVRDSNNDCTTTEGTMNRVLSTLLTEMDGFDQDPPQKEGGGADDDDDDDWVWNETNKNDNTNKIGRKIAVIGITHNIDWIDPALRRPGRLEKVVCLNRPEISARKSIILQELNTTTTKEEEEEKEKGNFVLDFENASFFEPKTINELADSISIQTEGMTAAEVISVCQEAKLGCIRDMIEQDKSIISISMGEDNGRNALNAMPRLRYCHFKAALT